MRIINGGTATAHSRTPKQQTQEVGDEDVDVEPTRGRRRNSSHINT